VVEVVVKKLAPLHHHVGQPGIGGYLCRRDEAGGEEPRPRLSVPVVQPLRVKSLGQKNRRLDKYFLVRFTGPEKNGAY
jgi:hypothetical protein